MPGSRPRAAIRFVIGSGNAAIANIQRYIRPGRLRPCVTLPISPLEISFAWFSAWLIAVTSMSSSSWASAAFKAAGSTLMDKMVPSHFAVTLTAPPPLVASTVRLASCDWTSSICCCMRAACFINLPMLDIIGSGWMFVRPISGADLDDRSSKDFQRFLNQRIILEFGWVQLHGLHRRGRRGFGGGSGSLRSCGRARGRWPRNVGGGWLHLRFNCRWRRDKCLRAIVFDNFNVGIRDAEFGQLGRNQ